MPYSFVDTDVSTKLYNVTFQKTIILMWITVPLANLQQNSKCQNRPTFRHFIINVSYSQKMWYIINGTKSTSMQCSELKLRRYILWVYWLPQFTCLLSHCMHFPIQITYSVLLITNLTHFFNVFIYFTSLHVSSNPVLITRRINCINTSSSMYHCV
jgi:hypothetical protein